MDLEAALKNEGSEKFYNDVENNMLEDHHSIP